GAPTQNPCQVGSSSVKYSEPGCSQGPTTLEANGQCLPIAGTGLPADIVRLTGMTPKAAQVDCAATSTPSPIVGDGAFALCDLASKPTTCAGGSCVERPSASKICLAREGTHDCPAPSLQPIALTDPKDIVDSRTCDGCTCTSTASSCTNASLGLYS